MKVCSICKNEGHTRKLLLCYHEMPGSIVNSEVTEYDVCDDCAREIKKAKSQAEHDIVKKLMHPSDGGKDLQEFEFKLFNELLPEDKVMVIKQNLVPKPTEPEIEDSEPEVVPDPDPEVVDPEPEVTEPDPDENEENQENGEVVDPEPEPEDGDENEGTGSEFNEDEEDNRRDEDDPDENGNPIS